MPATSYRIGIETLADDAEDFQGRISKAYDNKTRPLCLCHSPALEMYIARLGDTYVVKRMPKSGFNHVSPCRHFEPPANLSGLGDVLGKAIVPQSDDTTLLKLDFSLSKLGKKASEKSDSKSDTVKSDGSKLTLLSFLHYLWHEADLDRWQPHFDKSRHWSLVRHRLLDAAANKHSKKTSISERIYLPEPYYQDTADASERHRKQFVAPFMPKDTSSKKEMIVYLAEVKNFESARFGFQIIIKNGKNFPIYLDDKLDTKLKKRFATEIALWNANENFHLLIIATVTINTAGSAQLEEAALMLVNEKWIPIEDVDEKDLIADLIKQERSFIKGLRFNVKDRPIATALLTDTNPPTAMYIIPTDADDQYQQDIEDISKNENTGFWSWSSDEVEIPSPPPVSYT